MRNCKCSCHQQGGDIIQDIKNTAEKIGIRRRNPSKYPPKVRNLLSKIANEKVNSLKIVRTPLSSFVTSLLNLISLGTYEKAVKDSPFDRMFHLSIYINNKYVFEKNSVISLTEKNPVEKNSETKDVTITGYDFTIGEMVDKTKSKMGEKRFSTYRSTSWNCQDLILNLLEANNLLTDDLKTFVYQNPQEIFSRMPQFAQKIGQTLTDASAIADKIVEGEGNKKSSHKRTNPWIEHIKKYKAKHPKMSLKEIIIKAKETYKK